MMGKILIYGCSNAGGRPENEDSYGLFMEDGRAFAVVADGLGGHGEGKKASSSAVSHLMELKNQAGMPDQETIRKKLCEANEEILKTRQSRYSMKTTVVFLCITETEATWAHIGDSRLYHFFEGELCDCTLDHSVSQLAVALGEIERKQIPGHKERSRLLRVLGDDEVLPDIREKVSLSSGSHAFLLCSDGFWEHVTENEMLADLYCSRTPKEWVENMCLRLCQRITESSDNFTAAAVFVEV